MAKSSILGGEHAANQPSGRSAELLGPSDSSDSGSDSIGELGADQLASDSDRNGTGERASADPQESGSGLDILPDHLDRASASAGGAEPDELDVDQLAASEDDEDGDAGERT